MPSPRLILALVLATGAFSTVRAQVYPISGLDFQQTVQKTGEPRAGLNSLGSPMRIGGHEFKDGLGTMAPSKLVLNLKKNGVRFTASVGVDDAAKGSQGSVVFRLIGDSGRVLWESPAMKPGDAPLGVDVDLKGQGRVSMEVESASGDQPLPADWGDAKVELHSNVYSKVFVNTVPSYEEKAEILTPRPGPTPRITGPKVFGVRPGSPVLFTITATGDRPMEFAAEGLPEGLQLDPKTGRLSGSLKEKGDHVMTVRAKNAAGEASRPFRIVCGDTIGLVPAMGWSSWNCFANNISDQNIRDAADAMVSSGLVDHGWSYINIDEGWQRAPNLKDPALKPPTRDASGNILPNDRFPDMKGLVDYIHGKGLRAGIYTSPGPLTCEGFEGSYKHEQQDAQVFADWGIDYLKHDVCSYNKIFREESKPGPSNDLKKPMDPKGPEFRAVLQKPWRVMRAALDTLNRDLIYSISGNVRDWGAEIGANSWRVSSDVVDSWLEIVDGWRMSVSEIGFDRFREEDRKGRSGPELASPGHFNDRDMLVVGQVGWNEGKRPTRLTPNEQYTHISMWCLLASPLMIGCDMTKLDDFTLSLLSNDEVLEVNQDPLGKQADRISKKGDLEVWSKPMEDGSLAVGLFNRGYLPADVTVGWTELGISGRRKVRDLWRQKDLGDFEDSFTAKVPRHGVVLVRIAPQDNSPSKP